MTASVTQADLLKPPVRPLGQRLFDIGLWGGIAILLVISFGPAEILDGGRYGRLVPIADEHALAEAITVSLTHEPDRGTLRARGAAYSLERCAAAYLALFDRLTPRR